MKKIQVFALFLVTLLLGYSASLRAEDIDIYVSNAENVGVPNVLFVIDNGADFSANASLGCSGYLDGSGVPSAGTSNTAGVLQCSFVAALSGLATASVNIGFMVSNANNFAETQPTTDQSRGGYHEPCHASGAGGCLLRKLTPMDETGKQNMIRFIKGWKVSGQSNQDEFNIKVNSSLQASVMQEAWAYFNGGRGLSGTSYSPSILGTGCQRNFIIYVTNTQKNPSSNEYNSAKAAMQAAEVGATTQQLADITGKIKFQSAVCGNTTEHTLLAGNNFADEWARFLYQKDGGEAGNQGTQNVITYTIGVQSSGNQCSPETYGLVASMAKQGGGKFFNIASVGDLVSALSTVLNEVQAVNSVFSSASLPVSVNAQGTYLNQIYLGMFRPDSTGSPRWMGNLKQYKLIKDSTGSLVLGDAQGNSAISASGTGFISPTAVSYWTYKDTASQPDSLGGFFVNGPLGTPLSGYDSPDGEVVEKGGAAQQLRKTSLTATFAGAGNTSSNPRRLYTYCPAGSSCSANLTDSTNDFSTANAAIPASAFGSSTTLRISSIIRSGTTATVTTVGVHGFSSGSTVTVSNVNETEYNGDKTITVTGTNTFTFTVGDNPTTPSQGAYIASKASAVSVSLNGVSRSGTSTGNTDTATVTTSGDLSVFPPGSTVTISGFSPSQFNGSVTVLSNSGSSLTYSVPVYPVTPAVNSYRVVHAPYTRSISSIVTTGSGGTKTATVTTSAAHGFHTGQSVTVSGTSENAYNGSRTITVTGTNTFTFSVSGNPTNVTSGSVAPQTTAQTISSLTRSGTGATATATAVTSAPNNWFANGDVVNISTTGTSPNESAYVVSNATISCSSPCTTFTYSVATSPVLTGTGSGLASVPSSSAAIPAGNITRTATGIATATGIPAGTFATGDSVAIAPSGTSYSNESAYVGTWSITCPTATCTSFTFGPVTLTPASPASGANMQVYSASTPPDKASVIKWLRGEDNFGDELGPCPTVSGACPVTVRPSVHADVLHSRPLVVNYGDSRGIVVFYGTNDGIFRAVNGNQSTAIGAVPAGGELWGLVLTEHYGNINRQRVAAPEMKFPTTQLATATTKDYFVDGPTGAYQKLKADGTIDKSYIYLTMRRGGRFIYALDVSEPQTPTVLWKIDTSTAGFEELGQTWSRPRLTLLQSSTYRTTPVLVFGGGYDTAEDSEPPGTDTSGRGVYIINAETGELIWSATRSCTASSTCLPVAGMTHAIPSEVAFVDRDFDNYTDKIYVGDLGGNVWRIDVADADRANWKVTKLAALGCNNGTCASGTTPRKFFFPPAVLTIKEAGAVGSYDAISIVSGDREHPLRNEAAGSAYNTADKFFMIKDQTTTVNPSTMLTSNLTMTTLANATSTAWNGTGDGFFISFATGEKGVNAPLALQGSIFFSTNQPSDPSATCAPNLGTARAYAVSPFTSEFAKNTLAGGGLPPSPVAGLVTMETRNPDGSTSYNEEKFCIGCGLASPPGSGAGGGTPTTPTTCTGNAALQNCTPIVNVSGNVKRTYWYKK